MKIRTMVWGLVLTCATGSVAWSQTLADVARKEEERRKAVKAPGKVYTDDDLRKYPVASPDPTAQPAEVKPAAAGEAAGDKAKPVDPKDVKPSIDQGEDHWRRRMGEARAARALSATYLEALETRLASLTSDFYSQQDPALRSAIWVQRTRVFEDLERLKKDITGQDAAIVAIEDDAKKANIPPGWIR